MTAPFFEIMIWAQFGRLLLRLAIPLALGGCVTGASTVPTPKSGPETVAVIASTPVLPAATATKSAPPSPTPNPTPTPELTALLQARARHRLGDPQAPVTLIELSDFK